MVDVELLIQSLKTEAQRVQRDDPAFWDAIPEGPIPPAKRDFKLTCWWAIKQYHQSDQATRDLPQPEHRRQFLARSV